MEEKKNKAPSFVELVDAQLRGYQIEKILKMDVSGKRRFCEREIEAKQTLIQLDDELDITKNSEEEVCVGRWSNYRVPEKVIQRLSMSQKTKRLGMGAVPNYRYMQINQKGQLPIISRSQKTIPKLKVILHQYDCSLNVQSQRKKIKGRSVSSANTLKQQVSCKALMTSNKQELRMSQPGQKSQRKTIIGTSNTIDFIQNIENKRPPTARSISFKGQTASTGYQKIKRSFGHQEHQLISQKQILSQLIKGNLTKTQSNETPAPLSSMLNYFTMTSSDTKKKISMKLGLDKLLS